MTVDLDKLAIAAAEAAAENASQRPTGVARLIVDLHRGDAADLVTLESIALPPIPVEHDGRIAVAALIASPAGDGLWRPWARVVWSWPDGDVLVAERLARPADPLAFDASRSDYLDVCSALDTWLASRDPDTEAALRDGYRRWMDADSLAHVVGLLTTSARLLDDSERG